MKMKSTAIAFLIAFSPMMANAGLNGDTATVNYGGWIYDNAGAPSPASAAIGAGMEFSQSFTDLFGQVWTVNGDFSDDSLSLAWTESTRSPGDGNISSAVGLFTLDYSFNLSSISSVALTSFASTGQFSPGTSSLGLITTGANSFQLQFSRLDDGDSYNLSINGVANPVPEPETYAMMLAGLGLLGLMARRRKQLAA